MDALTPSPTVAATPTVAPTASPTPRPLNTVGCSAVSSGPLLAMMAMLCTGPMVLSLPDPGARLEPGLYWNRDFQPKIWFQVGEGWTHEQRTAGFFDIQDEPGSLDVVAVQFANVDHETLDAAVAELTDQPNIRILEKDSSTIDGRTGVVIVVETTDPPETDPALFRPVLTTAAGPVSIASGRRLWVSLLPVENGVLAVMVGGSIAEWRRALALAEPVLESVRILE